MKAINKFFYALLAFATVGMVACSEDATHEPGPAELEGCYGVYFPEASVLETQGPMGEISVDPSEATVFKYYAYRENTEGQITVPVEVDKNTTDKDGNPMYTITEIVFADGEDVAEFTVTLSDKAEVGVPYTLTLSVVNDPQYVKQYDTANKSTFSVTINRVKWISLGRCQFTEDLLTSWWGFGFDPTHPTYFVEVQVRADSIDQAAFDAARAGTGDDSGLSGVYRMVNGWLVGPWGDDSDEAYNAAIAANPVYTIINAQPYNKVWIPLQEVGLSINGGMASINSYPAALTDMNRAGDITDDMYGKIENGAITFPAERSLLGCPGGDYVGTNTYSANTDGAFKLVLSAALGTYELAMPDAESDGDFSFNEVALPEGAMFYSESQAASFAPVLEKGRCEVNTKDADRDFYKEYGILYRLPNLYTDGYPIYFSALEDGTVTLPTVYVAQQTGIIQNGYPIQMAIDVENSKFDPATGLLSLVAEFIAAEGNKYVSYGKFQELIAVEAPKFPVTPMMDLKNDFSYAPLFNAPLTSDFMAAEYEVSVEKGVCTNYDLNFEGTAYRLKSLYANGYDIYLAADADGKVIVAGGFELQPTGVNIYGKAAYMQIVSGTANDKGITFTANVCDVEGNELLPAACTESVVSYTWVDVATGSWQCTVLNAPLPGLTLQNAEGTNLYRVLDFMSAVTGEEGVHFTFTWDTTTNLCELQGLVDTGIPASALGVNAPGNISFVDEKTFWNMNGFPEDTWESLAAEYGVSVQPYFDAENNAFVFRVAYYLPEVDGALQFKTSTGDKTYFTTEVFVLDAAPVVSTWTNVAIGKFLHGDNFWLPEGTTPPAVESDVLMQRYGQSDNYRIMIVNGQVPLEFTFNESTGAVSVPAQKTDAQYKEDDGSLTDILMGDAWAMFQAWGNPKGYTAEQVYKAYPNAYDAENKIIQFCLAYFDVYGYTYTDASPAVHAYQITGPAPESSSVAPASAAKVPVKKYARVQKNEVAKTYKALNLGVAKAEKAVVNGKARSLKTATPVKRQTMVLAF